MLDNGASKQLIDGCDDLVFSGEWPCDPQQQQQHHHHHLDNDDDDNNNNDHHHALKYPDDGNEVIYVEESTPVVGAASPQYGTESSDHSNSPRSPSHGETSDDSSGSPLQGPVQEGSAASSDVDIKPLKASARLQKKPVIRKDSESSGDSNSSTSYCKISARGRRAKRSTEPYDMTHLPKSERNRESAARYRQRRKEYVQTLEEEVSELKEMVGTQQSSMEILKAENVQIKERLGFLQRICEASGLNVSGDSAKKSGKAAVAVLFILFSCMLVSVPFSSMLGVSLSPQMNSPPERYDVMPPEHFQTRKINWAEPATVDTTASLIVMSNGETAVVETLPGAINNNNNSTVEAMVHEQPAGPAVTVSS